MASGDRNDLPPITTTTLKRKINFLDDDVLIDEEGGTTEPTYYAVNKRPSSSTLASPPSPKQPSPTKYNLNLAPLENQVETYIPLFSIYVGNGLVMATHKFRNEYYSAFQKNEEGGLKNRLNIPVRQLQAVKMAVQALEEHINKQ